MVSQVVTMCVGDSITMGSPTFRGGYRRPLNDLAPNLRMVGRNCVDGTYGYTVGNHEGYGGRQISLMSSDVLPVVDTYAPSVILLLGGTNDLSASLTVAATLTAIRQLAEDFKAKASVTRVLVSNLPPREPADSKYQQNLDFNAGLAAAFATASSGITVHDICSGLTFTGPVQMADGLHPNDVGYAAMAQRWLTALRAVGIHTQRDAGPRVRAGGGEC